MSTTSLAGFLGPICGLLFAETLAGEDERPVRFKLFRLSLEVKISMLDLDGRRSVDFRLVSSSGDDSLVDRS